MKLLEYLIFNYPDYEKLAHELKVKLGKFSISHFPNKELFLTLSDKVMDKKCLILGSITPPEINLVAFLMLSHTLKKEGAKKIVGFIPYLAYSRQEKEELKRSQMTALVGKLLDASGVDELITIDIHNKLSQDLFPFPVHSLSPAEIFAEEIKKLKLTNALIVSPDEGAIQRCKDVAFLLGKSENVVWMEKTRGLKKITHKEIEFDVRENIVIIDDILDTGGTLISCCEKLLKRGAKEITIMVTHGLFTGEKWKRLFELGVKKIYCTETVNNPKIQGVKVLSILPILKGVIDGKIS